MGEQNNTTSYLMVKNSDGGYQKLDIVDFSDIGYDTFPADGELANGVTYHLTPTDMEGKLTLTLKYPKQMRCKSRKRYVKLLMSRGIDRNTAKALSGYMRTIKQLCGLPFSYQAEWNRDFWCEWPQKGEVTNVH